MEIDEIIDRISIDRLKEICDSEREGRCVLLPSSTDEKIHAIELALKIKLYDWQKAFIFTENSYRMKGRQTGYTTAYILKMLLNDGESIHLYKYDVLSRICDGDTSPEHYQWFLRKTRDIYYELSNPGLKLKIRKVFFTKKEMEREQGGV